MWVTNSQLFMFASGVAFQVLYTHYLERHRNLQYLEAQLEGYHKAEQEAMDAEDKRLRKIQKRLA